ncbi:MAG: hypothetical protein IJ519_01810 [Clostridia bacterium]|nr:hypothetical protein [Clostridia bacterium]
MIKLYFNKFLKAIAYALGWFVFFGIIYQLTPNRNYNSWISMLISLIFPFSVATAARVKSSEKRNWYREWLGSRKDTFVNSIKYIFLCADLYAELAVCLTPALPIILAVAIENAKETPLFASILAIFAFILAVSVTFTLVNLISHIIQHLIWRIFED